MSSAALLVGAVLLAVLLVAGLLLGDAAPWRQTLLALELRLPLGLTTDDVHRWLNTVAAATAAQRFSLFNNPPLVLEVTADAAGIRHYLVFPRAMRAAMLSGLRAALPGVRVEKAAKYLTVKRQWTAGAEAMLDSRQRQMATDRTDITATAVLATLQPLTKHERVVVQWVIGGARTPEPVPSLVAGRKDELPDWLAGEELTDGDAIRSARQ